MQANRFKLTLFFVAALGVGVLSGMLIPADGIRPLLANGLDRLLPATTDDGDPAPKDEQDSKLVHLSENAIHNLGLKTGRSYIRDYVSHRLIPAFVREQPAVSDLHIASRFDGVVRRVFAVPGQAVREGDPLFEIELTGDSLASAQAALLDAVQQLEITDTEIRRLTPIAEQGGVAARNKLQMEYERRRLAAQQETKRQELIVRGLSEDHVEHILNSKQLVRTSIVTVPTGFNVQAELQPEVTAHDHPNSVNRDPWSFTVEELNVAPGSMVSAGEPLCGLAWHSSLYVEGQAFEDDIDTIRQLMAQKTGVDVELGADDKPFRLPDRRITHLDNHVDPETHTFRCYLPLRNEVLQDVLDPQGRRFRSWRFRPGQRGHVLLPDGEIREQIPLPAEAVVEDGTETLVFREVSHGGHSGHGHAHDDEADDAPHAHADDSHDGHDFEPVSVSVLYRDRRTVVVSSRGELRPGDEIAMNSAYQLLLAMKSGSGGGNAHHGHDH